MQPPPHARPCRNRRDKVGCGKLFEQVERPADAEVRHRSGRFTADFRRRSQGEQTQQSRLLRRQLPVRRFEERAESDSRRHVLGAPQLIHEGCDGTVAALPQHAGGDPQRERMVAAERGELRDSLRFTRRPIVAAVAEPQGPADEVGGILRLEDIEVDQLSVQLGEPVPRGDQHSVMIGSRNQRPHLLRIRDIVEQQQHRPPLLPQQPPIQPVLPRRRLRKIRPPHPHPVQQRDHRLIRRNRVLVVPPKVDEQSPARKPPVPDRLMGRTQRQRRLPDPAKPGHRADHHRQIGLGGRVQYGKQPCQVLVPPGEPRRHRRQRGSGHRHRTVNGPASGVATAPGPPA